MCVCACVCVCVCVFALLENVCASVQGCVMTLVIGKHWN